MLSFFHINRLQMTPKTYSIDTYWAIYIYIYGRADYVGVI